MRQHMQIGNKVALVELPKSLAVVYSKASVSGLCK